MPLLTRPQAVYLLHYLGNHLKRFLRGHNVRMQFLVALLRINRFPVQIQARYSAILIGFPCFYLSGHNYKVYKDARQLKLNCHREIYSYTELRTQAVSVWLEIIKIRIRRIKCKNFLRVLLRLTSDGSSSSHTSYTYIHIFTTFYGSMSSSDNHRM